MKYLVTIYRDDGLLAERPEGAFETMMQGCLDAFVAEPREWLATFPRVEATDMDEAVCPAAEFPWACAGAIEALVPGELAAPRCRVGA